MNRLFFLINQTEVEYIDISHNHLDDLGAITSINLLLGSKIDGLRMVNNHLTDATAKHLIAKAPYIRLKSCYFRGSQDCVTPTAEIQASMALAAEKNPACDTMRPTYLPLVKHQRKPSDAMRATYPPYPTTSELLGRRFGKQSA